MRVTSVVLVLVAFLACRAEEPEYVEPIRAIKTYTVSHVASGRTRRYSGIVEAADFSELSFEVGGNVRRVEVALGDRVVAGQVLAVLDEEPYRLDVEAAEAELQKSVATVEERRANFERYRSIIHTGAVSRADFESARASYEAAQGQVRFHKSRLNLARRDLGKTTLAAPYAGTIGWKQVEPFVEVRAGQKLFQINAEGGLEVRLNVPETTINQVAVGLPAVVRFPTLPGVDVESVVSEVGTVAIAANAYPVQVALSAPPESVRNGMTAEVSLVLAGASTDGALLVPAAALAAADESGTAHVFVYDAETSTVRRVRVEATEGVDNYVAIRTGLSPGDVVAVAGAHFLVDGQEVRLYQP